MTGSGTLPVLGRGDAMHEQHTAAALRPGGEESAAVEHAVRAAVPKDTATP